MIIELLTLLVSLAVLAKAADVVVSSTAKLSNYFGISQMAIGFLLIAVITSLPEFVVSVLSSHAGNGAIAAGNVFGSNIANILLILGVGAAIYGIKITKDELDDIGLVLLLTTALSVYIVFSNLLLKSSLGVIDGAVLLLLFAGYSYYTMRTGKGAEKRENVTKQEAFWSFLYFVVSIGLVLVSASFVVSSAVALSERAGVSQSFIGATIIAVGTSLPEFSIALQALRKRHYGIALGDAIGSNITNLTLVLGAAAVINPIPVVLPVFIAALLFAFVADILMFYAAAVHNKLTWRGGILFLLIYAAYLISILYLQVQEMPVNV
ncbi:MAG: sodium:calcium antiporter [Candidatus Micrarchaeota archaeon]|nr:sodium:calcium antiporter [Candidatus Micrarchaeota archaeon]